MLEFLEERTLARRWREQQDSQAASGLVTSHLRLVVKIAMGYRGYGLPIGELISEGNLGLIQAVTRFEPERGFRVSTYARWWIRASIQEYVLRSWSLVRMGSSSNSKKLFFNLRHVKSRLSAYEDGDLKPEHVSMIAIRLGVPQKDVIEMNRRLGGDASLNAPIADRGEGGGERQDWLVDACDNQEKVLVDHEEADYRQIALRSALEVLNPRERRILEARKLTDHPLTLTTLAAEFGVSRERVRQIEARAFGKVQREVCALVARIEEPPAEAHLGGMLFIPDVHGTHKTPQGRIRH
jgi:RNA polymerase sigma-32 factor